MPVRSAVDDEEMTRLHAQGLNDVQIARAMDRSRNTIASARTRLGLPAQDKSEMSRAAGKKGGKPADLERIAYRQNIASQMHGEGKKNTEIAQVLGVSPSRVTQILKSVGLVGAQQPGRGITVTHKPTNARPLNEFYRMARQARAKAWQRVYG